jgi:hypothetical protein
MKEFLQTLAGNQTSIASFFYGTDYEANIQADDAIFPMLHVQTIVNSGAEFSDETGGVRKTYPLFLFFCQKGDIDMTTEQQDVTAEAMKDLAIEYIARINKTKQFDHVSKIQFKHLFYKFDMSVCGVLTMINLRQKKPFGVCV